MITSHAPKEIENLSDKILYMMLENMMEAKFARKVMDIIIERNDDDISTWEYEPNDRLRYFHMESNFESGIHGYCMLKSLYESINGEMPKSTDDAINKSAEALTETKLVKCGWKKGE